MRVSKEFDTLIDLYSLLETKIKYPIQEGDIFTI